jgi:hypothetical protein
MSSHGPRPALEWPTWWVTTAPWPRGSGTSLSSFRGRVSTGGRSRCVSSSGPETRPCPSSAQASRSNVRWLSQGAGSAAAGAPGCPASRLAARLARRSQRCAHSSARRGCRPPTSLPEAVHERAMTTPMAVPTGGTRSVLRAALCPANYLASCAPSIDHTAGAPRVHGDTGAGHTPSAATRGPRTS